MIKDLQAIEYLGNYYSGQFQPVENVRSESKLVSPAAFIDEIGCVEYTTDCFDEVVETARRACSVWGGLKFDSRLEHIKVVGQKIAERREQFVEVICRETGKSRWEANLEVSSAVNRAEKAVEQVMDNLKTGEFSAVEDNFSADSFAADAAMYDYEPRGVALIISPFGRPLDSAVAMLFSALALGNVVVFRPNKFVPFTGQLLARCFDEARVPAGVFSLVHGQKEHSRRLAARPDIDSILFSGPYEFSQLIKHDIADQIYKTSVFETGGKNAVIVHEDAAVDLAVAEAMLGAYITAGQYAFATSRVLVHDSIADEFIGKLHRSSKKVVIGHPLDTEKDMFMGPLIDKVSVERYLKFQSIALREGGECIMRGKSLSLDPEGFYVTPSIYLFEGMDNEALVKSTYLQTEIFGPSIAVFRYKDVEEAVSIANSTSFGLVCSVFSQAEERSVFKEMRSRLYFGTLNLNVGTHRQSYQLPSAGMGRSSNGRPTSAGIGPSLVNVKSSLLNDSQTKVILPVGITLEK